jgi:2'-5' RNA ligase
VSRAADAGVFGDPDLLTGRLFFGIEIPGKVKSAVDGLRPELARVLPGARFTEPTGWHLTLAFLGQVRAEHSADVVAVGEDSASAAGGRPEIRLEGAGAFPDAERARAVWAGVAGEAELLAGLATSLADGCRAAGLRAEDRPFTPHLTLARLPEPGPVPDGLLRTIAAAAEAAPGWTVRRLACFRSTMTNRGARYTVVRTFPLARADAAADELSTD